MNPDILRNRIYHLLTDEPMGTIEVSTPQTEAQEDGSVSIEMVQATQDVYMDDMMAERVADAVSDAVVEFLRYSVRVDVGNEVLI